MEPEEPEELLLVFIDGDGEFSQEKLPSDLITAI